MKSFLWMAGVTLLLCAGLWRLMAHCDAVDDDEDKEPEKNSTESKE